jgi:hypothetical protein
LKRKEDDMHDYNTYDTANEAVLFCKEYLEERRLSDAASYLEGLDAITDQNSSGTAHARLEAVKKLVRDPRAQHAITLALNAVERALQEPVLLAG